MSSVQSTDQLQPRGTLGETPGIPEPEQQPGSISVIVPTYNEFDNIVPVVNRLQDALQAFDYDIIVVDDDSPDGTWKIARREFRYDNTVEVYRRTDERGLATAVSFGFEQSEKDYCAVIDADLQHPPEEIPRLLAHASGGTDIVIGTRTSGG